MIRPVLEGAARLGGLAVRAVSPMPPHEPETLPGEPFAPVYSYAPAGDGVHRHGVPWPLPEPYPADPLVFGVPLLAHEVRVFDEAPTTRTCRRCWVKWAGPSPACWCCGPPS